LGNWWRRCPCTAAGDAAIGGDSRKTSCHAGSVAS
jgi:hypothetical protein